MTAQAEPDSPSAQHAIPFHRSRPLRIGFLVAAAVVLVALAGWLRSVTTPVLVALVIAYVLDPVVTQLE
jgi:predicted PurR-regulated permease PerM